jgi:hypothetical protein
MTTAWWNEGRHLDPERRSRRLNRGRAAAFAALIAAGLMLAAAPASAADAGASGPQAGNPRHRVSPYARFAREHEQLVGRNPARVSPTMHPLGHAPRAAGHTRR